MMNKSVILKLKIFILLFAICSLLFASAANAAPLVPCGPGTDGPEMCNFCHLLQLGENIIDFAYKIALSIAVIFIIYGGFVILTAGDSTEKVANGRKTITSAVIGVVIILTAWLLISQVLQILVKPGALQGDWWNPAAQIRCAA